MLAREYWTKHGPYEPLDPSTPPGGVCRLRRVVEERFEIVEPRGVDGRGRVGQLGNLSEGAIQGGQRVIVAVVGLLSLLTQPLQIVGGKRSIGHRGRLEAGGKPRRTVSGAELGRQGATRSKLGIFDREATTSR